MVLAKMIATRKGIRVEHGLSYNEVLGTFEDVLDAAAWAEANGYFFITCDRQARGKRRRQRERRPVRKVALKLRERAA